MSKEEKTLGELLAEYRKGMDYSVVKDAEKHKGMVDYVEANRSGLVSAMIKATRMRKMQHALYYGAVLLVGGQDKWYIGRRVAIMACEDGVDDVVMEYVSKMHVNKQKDIKDIMKAIVAINLRPNWWEEEYGRNLMYGCFREKNVDLTPQDTEESLVELMERCLFKEKSLEAWITSSRIYVKLIDDYGWTLNKLHKWWIEKATEYATEEWETRLIESFTKMTPDMVKFNDGNWNYNFRYMMCLGRNPNVTSMEQLEKEIEEYDEMIDKILEIAEEKAHDREVVVPPWAFDGMHASKKANYSWADKRFPGSYKGFYNCMKMYEEYGRLDPRDQGMLDGCRVPEEGLVLMNEFLDDIEL